MLESRCKGCFAEIGTAESCPYCGFNPSRYVGPVMSMPLDAWLNNRYLIGRVLGSGGFGITYIAFDTKLSIPVAIKEYLPKMMATRRSGDTTVQIHSETEKKDYLHFMDSFLDEARLLAKFNNESGIVSVIDLFEENGTAYIVMLYVNGITLSEYLQQQGGKIGYETAFQILSPVMESLGKVHQVGLIHRDISPDNLYLTGDNQVRLLDFGAARYFVGQGRSTVSVMLKHGYAPPEQYSSRKTDQGPWTDVYGMAATLYRMITGTVPEAAIERMQGEPLVSLSEQQVVVPTHVDVALQKALSMKPAQRQQTMDAFRRELIGSAESAEPDESAEAHLNSEPRDPGSDGGTVLIPAQELLRPGPKTEPSRKKWLGMWFAKCRKRLGMWHPTSQNRLGMRSPTGQKRLGVWFFSWRKRGPIMAFAGVAMGLLLLTLLLSGMARGWFMGAETGSSRIAGSLSVPTADSGGPSEPEAVSGGPSEPEAVSGGPSEPEAVSGTPSDHSEETTPTDGDGTTLTAPIQMALPELPTLPASGVLDVKDPILEQALREAMNMPQGELRIEDTKKFTSLSLEGLGISDIDPLKHFANLRDIRLGDNRIADISALAYMKRLAVVDLTRNQVSSIEPLRYCTQMTGLTLSENLVEDASPLANLQNLTSLTLNDNPVWDISPLQSLSGLMNLGLYATQVSDLEPLRHLTALQDLGIHGIPASNLEPVRNLRKLETLHMGGSKFTTLSALEDLTALKSLDISYLEVSDITPIAGLVNLESFWMMTTKVTDISVLANFKKLKVLYLSGTPVSDHSPLQEVFPQLEEIDFQMKAVVSPEPAGSQSPVVFNDAALEKEFRRSLGRASGSIYPADLKKFTRLVLEDMGIQNVDALAHCTNLDNLDLSGNPIENISALSACTSLTYLDLSHTQVESLNALKPLRSLRSLWLSHMRISSVEPLRDMSQLQELDIELCGVSDISAVTSMPKLKFLGLYGNPIDDYSPIAAKELLVYLTVASDDILDIEFMRPLMNLESIHIGPTRAVSLEPLRGKVKMREVNINGNAIPDLRPLRTMPNLWRLELSECILQDVTPLADIKSLRKLFLKGSQITDLSPLKGLIPQLTEYDFQ